MQGDVPQQLSQAMGNSDSSQPCLLISDLVARFLSLAILFQILYECDQPSHLLQTLMETKNICKLGEMIVDSKQIFWRRQHVFAFIPYVQLLKGHVIITTKRNTHEYKDLECSQLFDLTLTIKFVSKSLEAYFGATSTTVYVQQSARDGTGLGQLVVHVFPRKNGDFKKHQQLYDLIDKYPSELTKYYNEKIASYGNAFVGKILEGINEERMKYEEFMNSAYKDEQSF